MPSLRLRHFKISLRSQPQHCKSSCLLHLMVYLQHKSTMLWYYPTLSNFQEYVNLEHQVLRYSFFVFRLFLYLLYILQELSGFEAKLRNTLTSVDITGDLESIASIDDIHCKSTDLTPINLGSTGYTVSLIPPNHSKELFTIMKQK